MSEINELRREVAMLREELGTLKAMLGAASIAVGDGLPHLRCASLSVIEPGAIHGPGEAQTPRFEVKISIGEHGGALHLTDELAGETRERAALLLTEAGTTLALCGEDGAPRVVAQSRLEGGGASFLDQNRELAAEVWGAGEASWLGLYHEGKPAVMGVAMARGGTLEAFDAQGELQGAVPPAPEEVFPPPATSHSDIG